MPSILSEIESHKNQAEGFSFHIMAGSARPFLARKPCLMSCRFETRAAVESLLLVVPSLAIRQNHHGKPLSVSWSLKLVGDNVFFPPA